MKFPTTNWTLVLSARGKTDEAQEALKELCEDYYQPVWSYIRKATNETLADDMTQGFFSQLLEKSGIDGVRKENGRFRSYILGAVKHFISDWRERERAQKRGGDAEILSLEDGVESSWLNDEDDLVLHVDPYFDRQWAISLVEKAKQNVAEKYAKLGKTCHFEVLSEWLSFEGRTTSDAEVAEKLGVGIASVRVFGSRIRKEFRKEITLELRKTISDESELQVELDYLIRVLETSSSTND